MKKLFFGIAILAIFSISITGILINEKNNTLEQQNNSNNNSENLNEENENQNIDVGISNKEKTIDLYGLYDENDLEIMEVTESNITFPQIKGLKNKNVEEKINSDIRKRVTEKVDEVCNEYGKNSLNSIYYNVNSNFANVISISQIISCKYHAENVDLNYELINGERLKFEDLFLKDADLHSIVRRCCYRAITQEVYTSEEFYDLHFDLESNKWVATYWDWETGQEVEREYIPNLTEYEINKMIKKFFDGEEKAFHFTPTRLMVSMPGDFYYSCQLEFKDIADVVTIYDKYLTKESLYEADNIGRKNLWTCSIPNPRNEYLNYGFIEDNLFYDISATSSVSNLGEEFPFTESVKLLKNKMISSNDKLEEYRNMANQNKDKFYMLQISSFLSNDSYDKIYNIASFETSESLYQIDIKFKADVMDSLIECYRYYNLGFYGSAFELFGGVYGPDVSAVSFDDNVKYKEETKLYDLRNLKEITSINEVFKSNVDYMSVIKEKLKLKIRNRDNYNYISDEKLNELVENSKYSLDKYGIGINVNVPEIEQEFTILFSEIDSSLLTIYDIDMNLYIIPESNTRKIEKTEIQNLTLDELNKAYNEIFARHGHDFKNVELKEYFNELSWYEPLFNKSVSLEELNEIEKFNLGVIKEVIEDKKK